MGATTTGLAARWIELAAHTTTSRHRRRITPQAGRALEILGHAIEYLADEYAQEAKVFSTADPQVEAIQLLMALNREIYYACSLVPTFRERLTAFFHPGAQ